MKIFTKILLLITILFFMKSNTAQTKLKLGMSLEEVQKIYPNLKSSKYENTITLTRPESIHGLESEWGYRFEDNRLSWIYFMKYIDDIDESNFNKCLSSTKKIIEDFTKVYGNPDEVKKGNEQFVDPYKKRHWGYDVIKVKWLNYQGMKIIVEFNFFGGKGEYHFIVKIDYHDKYYAFD